jgi:methionyl-tRNA synthetase
MKNSMPKKFYVTTPIYYANGLPHIGHAYSSFIADAFARAKRLLGYQVKFSTGLDENGQKMVQKAESEGKDVMTFLDEIADGSLKIWEDLDISYTDFIRTTEARHHEFVQKTLNKIYDKQDGDIYRGEYVGLYCVGCEAFKNPRDLVNGVCPDHLTKPDEIKEKNWFFKLSKYQSFLETHFAQHPQFVQPQGRFNEVKSFV